MIKKRTSEEIKSETRAKLDLNLCFMKGFVFAVLLQWFPSARGIVCLGSLKLERHRTA